MGQQQSKDELLYQQVSYGNIEGIKSLRREGAGLEWIDKEGKTPLIAACMNPELYNVAKTLIELGANVNAYRQGRHAGTPLHHAAKRGLEQTVKLLLSHGANALVINDDCQTPLDIARSKGYSNVVRTIESHLCLFSGWLRELYGPGFLELFAPQLLSRKVWVVVLPCGSRNLKKPFKLELAIYTNLQDAGPRTIVALWKANMDEPNFNQTDPAVIISDISTIPRRWRRRRGIVYSQVARQTRIKLAAASDSNKQQLQWFCNACKGIPQVVHPTFPFNTQVPVVPPTAPPTQEDIELAMAINASLQTDVQGGPLHHDVQPVPGSGAGASTSITNILDVTMDPSSHVPGASSANQGNYKGCNILEESPSSVVDPHIETQNGSSVVQTTIENLVPPSIPSAPVADAITDNDGPINYPQIDNTPLDLSQPPLETSDASTDQGKDSGTSACVICLDAPVEGACIPCGHMAGCMSCLTEIKAKKWGCPVCRGKIDQVVRLYAV